MYFFSPPALWAFSFIHDQYDHLLSPSVHQSFTSTQFHLFSSTRCSPVSTLRETLTVWFSITLTDDLNTPPPQWFLYLSPSISFAHSLRHAHTHTHTHTHTQTHTLWPPSSPIKKAPTSTPLPKKKKLCGCAERPLSPALSFCLWLSLHTHMHRDTQPSTTPYILSSTHIHTHTLFFSTCSWILCACVCVSGGGVTLTNGIQQQGFILKHTDNAFHTYLPQQRWGRWAASYPGLKAG